MFPMKESVYSLKKTTPQHWCSFFQMRASTNVFHDRPVNYYLEGFRYMITRLSDRVQLSVYSTEALFYMYVLAMKYR